MNYYEILGLKKDATQKEIKSAYKKLVKKYHPDIYKGDKHFADKKIKEINNAYDTLSNPQLKQEYDLTLIQHIDHHENNEYYTPNVSYSSPSSQNTQANNVDFSSNTQTKYDDIIINKFDNLKKDYKLKIVFAIIFIYLLLFLVALFQLYNVISNNKSTNFDKNVYQNTLQYYPNQNNEFNLYNYFSEKDLLQIYELYYSEIFDSYEDFENYLSDYLQQNGY